MEPGHASSLDPGKSFHISKSAAKAQPAQPIQWVREEESRKEVGEKEVAKEEGEGDVVDEALAEHLWQ